MLSTVHLLCRKKPIQINILPQTRVQQCGMGWTGEKQQDEAMDTPSSVKYFRRQQHIARAGEICSSVYRVEEGWACRYCLLPDGKRQIAALYLPGDYCEPQWLLSGRADLPVMAMTGMRVREVSLASIHSRPGDGVKRLLGAMVQMLERQSRWIVSLGRKSAIERVSELLSELFERLHPNESLTNSPCAIPLTQRDIADVVGLTPVHVNRVLHDLRDRGFVELKGRTLMVRAGKITPI